MAEIPGADKAAEGAHKAGSALTKNVGPLPMGAWLVLVAGGLFFAYRVNSSKSSSSDVTIKTEPTSDLVGSGPGAVGWNVITQAPTPPAVSDTSSDITTNAEWYRAAYAYALTQNFSPALIDSALRKYLSAQAVTASEQAIIDAVVKKLGAPPELLPPTGQDVTPTQPAPDPIPKPVPTPAPVVTVPKPAPAPKPPPAPAPAVRHYVVQKWPAKGSTLWGIASIEYGNGALWPKIYNANRNIIKDPNKIYAGQNLVIPA